MKKNIVYALAAIILTSMGIVSSAEIKTNNQSSFEDDEWKEQKQKLVERAICFDLEQEVEHPNDPARYSSDRLNYETLAQGSRKFIAPLMISTTSIPYKDKDSLENVPIPNIESLSCTSTVEMWRAMYELKTIPYTEPKRNLVNDFLIDASDWIKKIFGYIIIFALGIASILASIFCFYNKIKLTNKSNHDQKLLGYLGIAFFPISPIAIAPLYFVWTVFLGHTASFISYFIGCTLFAGFMTLVFSIRKMIRI